VMGEGYLAADPGNKYALYFARGGSVGLKLDSYAGVDFESFADFDWRASWAPSMELQPDTKFTRYELEEDAVAPLLNFKQPSTLRTFGTLNEFLQDYYADVTVPFKTRLPFTDVWSGLIGEFKTGLAYSLRDRSFDYRRFSTDYPTNSGAIDLSERPESILRPTNYANPADAPLLRFREATRRSDTFDAAQEIAGAYGMLELPILPERLRLVGGVRVEYSYLTAEGVAILPPEPFRNIINDLDPLPGVTLIYSPLEAMNFRFAYSQTVSRPEFRELTPTQFPAAPGEPTFQGNPNLVSSSIESFDLRWEWFFSPLELASASVFYKDLKDPIEVVRIPETSSLLDTAINADSAYLWGIELEARKNFNFLVPHVRRWKPLRKVAPVLADLQISTNVSIVESEVKGLGDDPALGDILVPTNEKRALVGQAPFVINAALEYEHYRWGLWRLLYNTVGETINAGGVDIQPDDALPGLPGCGRLDRRVQQQLGLARDRLLLLAQGLQAEHDGDDGERAGDGEAGAGARSHAFLRRRGYVTPDDVRALGLDVLRHRVILTYEAEAENITSEDVVRRIFDTVEVP